MPTYLQMTNNVLDAMGWSQLTTGTFGSPSQDSPGAAVKRNLNLAKDQVLGRLGFKPTEEEFSFQTSKVHEGGASSQLTIVSPNTQVVLTGVGAPTIDSTFIGWKLRLSSSLNTNMAIDEAWYRVVSVDTGLNAVILDKTDWTGNITSAESGWELFSDEYTLDTSVRQVLNVWSGGTPMDMEIVTEHREHDRNWPGQVSFGDPERAMVFRSPTAGDLWQMQIHPMPKTQEFIRYKAKVWPADLTTSTGTWDLEPEVLGFIERAALQLTVNSPVESDPQLAVTIGEQVAADINFWSNQNKPRDPLRRRRREAPDGSLRRNRLRAVDLSE